MKEKILIDTDRMHYTYDNTHIDDSYEIINEQIMTEYILWMIEERKLRDYLVTRTIDSYKREWLGHNRLYEWGIARSHTESVDLQENESIIDKIIWMILGGF